MQPTNNKQQQQCTARIHKPRLERERLTVRDVKLGPSVIQSTHGGVPFSEQQVTCLCSVSHTLKSLSLLLFDYYRRGSDAHCTLLQARGQYHGGRRPSSDDSFHSPTVIPPSALDKPSIMKRYHRRRTCSHTSPSRSPTMVTFHCRVPMVE